MKVLDYLNWKDAVALFLFGLAGFFSIWIFFSTENYYPDTFRFSLLAFFVFGGVFKIYFLSKVPKRLLEFESIKGVSKAKINFFSSDLELIYNNNTIRIKAIVAKRPRINDISKLASEISLIHEFIIESKGLDHDFLHDSPKELEGYIEDYNKKFHIENLLRSKGDLLLKSKLNLDISTSHYIVNGIDYGTRKKFMDSFIPNSLELVYRLKGE
jgi:hypothetical protein